MAQFSLKQMNLQDYWNIVLRRRKMIILPIVIVMVLAIPCIAMMTPIYEAKNILISEKIDTGSVLEGVGRIKVPDAEKSHTAKDKILSGPYMRQVAEREAIIAYLRQNKKNKKKSIEIDDAVDYLRSITQVKQRQEWITIIVQHFDPKMATSVANTVGDIYVENTVESRKNAAETSYEFLETQVEEAAENLKKAENAYNTAREKGVMDTLKSEDAGVLGTINKLDQQLADVDWQLEEARSELEDARSSSRNPAIVSKYVDKETESLELQLTGLKAQLQRLLQTYNEEWPDVKKLKASILRVENELSKKGAKSSNAGMTREERVAVWQGQLKTLTNKKRSLELIIESRKVVLRDLPQRQAELEKLKQAKDIQADMYADILRKRNEVKYTRAAEIGQLGRVSKIFDEAVEPREPVKPDRVKLMMMAMGLGIMIACGAAFLAEYFDQSIHGPEDIKRYFAIPVMGTIPVLTATAPAERKKKQNIKKLTILIVMALAIGMLCVDILAAKVTGKKPMFVNLLRFVLRMIR